MTSQTRYDIALTKSDQTPNSNTVAKWQKTSELDVSSLINADLPKWKVARKAFTSFVMAQTMFERRYGKYYGDFISAYEKHKNYLTDYSFSIISDFFEGFIRSILEYEPEDLSIGFTSDDSLYLRIKFNGQNFHVEVFFSDDEIDLALNIYQDKVCIKAVYGPLDKILREFKEYDKAAEILHIQTAYDIPYTPLAPEVLYDYRGYREDIFEISNSYNNIKEYLY